MRAMRSKPSPDPRFRRETVIFIALGAFVVGIVAGVALTLYKLGGISGAPGASGPVAAPPSSPDELSTEREKALLGLQARVRSDPKDVDGWIQLGNLHFDLGQPLEAIRAYEKALALKPGDPDVLTDQGIMYRRAGQPEKAVDRFRQAHRAEPNHFQSLYNLGVVLLHDLNDVAGAILAWEEYLRVIPQGPQADRIRDIVGKLKAQGKLE
jgi:cytochrome c-type biogenesis protein CcmH/NrfG